VLDIADKCSPYLDVYARALEVRRETTIIAAGKSLSR